MTGPGMETMARMASRVAESSVLELDGRCLPQVPLYWLRRVLPGAMLSECVVEDCGKDHLRIRGALDHASEWGGSSACVMLVDIERPGGAGFERRALLKLLSPSAIDIRSHVEQLSAMSGDRTSPDWHSVLDPQHADGLLLDSRFATKGLVFSSCDLASAPWVQGGGEDAATWLGPIPQETIRAGVNATCGIQLKDLYAKPLEVFGTAEVATAALLLESGVPTLSFRYRLDDRRSVGPLELAFDVADVSFRLAPRSGDLRAPAVRLAGALSIGRESVPFVGGLDPHGGEVSLRVAELPALEAVAPAVGLDALDSLVPGAAGGLGGLYGRNLQVDLTLQPPTLRRIAGGVGTERPLELMPGLISVEPSLDVAIQSPLDAAKRHMEVGIFGRWWLGSTPLDVTVEPSLGELTASIPLGYGLDGRAVLEKILPGLPLPDLELLDLELQANYRTRSFSAQIEIGSDWAFELGTRQVVMTHLDLAVDVDNGALEAATLGGTLELAGRELSMEAGYAGESGWDIEAASPPGFALGLTELLEDVLDDAGIVLPPELPDVELDKLLISANSETRRFALRGEANTATPIQIGSREATVRLGLDLTFDPAARPKADGFVFAVLVLDGQRFDASLDLGQGGAISVKPKGAGEPIALSDILERFLPDTPRPAEIPDVLFSDLEARLEPANGVYELKGTAAIEWDLLGSGDVFETSVSLDLQRASTGRGRPASVRCALRLDCRGAVEVGPDLVLNGADVEFFFDREAGSPRAQWQAGGRATLDVLGHSLDLEVSYGQGQAGRSLRLAARFDEPRSILDISGVASLAVRELAVDLAKPSRGGGASGDRPPTESGTPHEQRQTRTPGLRWELSAAVDLALGELGVWPGTLEVGRRPDGTTGLWLSLDDATRGGAQWAIPLPLPGETDARLVIEVGDFELSKTAARGGRRSSWTLGSSTVVRCVGLPEGLDQWIPRELDTVLDIGASGIRLGGRLDPWEVDLGTFGHLRVDVPELAVVVGRDFSLVAELGLGLPAGINGWLGARDGEPIAKLFKTYVEGDAATLSRARLEVTRDGGVQITVMSSPFETMEVRDGWIDCDLGELGAVRCKVPVLTYEAGVGAFQAAGGFEITRPLAIPLTPMKAFLGACGFEAPASLLPESVPVEGVDIVDAQGRFKAEALLALLDRAGDVPSELRSVVKGFGEGLERLPKDFKDYLTIAVPSELFYGITLAPSGSFELELSTYRYDRSVAGDRARAKAEATPLRAIFPTIVPGPGGVPMPGLTGIQLRSLAFGPIAGGSLVQMQVDARMDQFDLATLATSLALPEAAEFPLPMSNEIRRTLILDDLYALVFYQAVVPVPVPLFYDEIGVEYMGIEGVGLQAHAQFPRPQVSIAALATLVAELGSFVRDSEVLLDPQALGGPDGLDLSFSLDGNYLQLPEYLGSGVLGAKGEALRIDWVEHLVHLLNGVKTLRLDELLQAIPLEHRVGHRSVTFSVLELEAEWWITTLDEFRADHRWQLSEQQIDDMVGMVPWPSDSRDGLLVFLRGGWDVDFGPGFDVCMGLVGTDRGFATGLRMTGDVGEDWITLELSGGILVAPKEEPALRLRGNAAISLFGNAFWEGEVEASESAFRLAGRMDFLPGVDELSVCGNLQGELSARHVLLAGAVEVQVGGYAPFLDVTAKLTESDLSLEATFLDQRLVLFMGREPGRVFFTASLAAGLRVPGFALGAGGSVFLGWAESGGVAFYLDAHVEILGLEGAGRMAFDKKGFQLAIGGEIFGLFEASLVVEGDDLADPEDFMVTAELDSGAFFDHLGEGCGIVIAGALEIAQRSVSIAKEGVGVADDGLKLAMVGVDKAEVAFDVAQAGVTAAQRVVKSAELGVAAAKKTLDFAAQGVDAAQKSFDVAGKGLDAAKRSVDVAGKAVDAAQRGFDAAKSGVSAARRGLRSAKSGLKKVKKGIDKLVSWLPIPKSWKKKLKSATRKLSKAKAHFRKMDKKLSKATAELTRQKKKLKSAKTALANQKRRFDAAKSALERKKKVLHSAKAALRSKKSALTAAKRKLRETTSSMGKAKKACEDQKKALEVAKIALSEARQELQEAKRTLRKFARIQKAIDASGPSGLLTIEHANFSGRWTDVESGHVDMEIKVGVAGSRARKVKFAYDFHNPGSYLEDLADRLIPDLV